MKNPWAWFRDLFARQGQDPQQIARYVLPYPVAGVNLLPDEVLSLATVWACIDAIARAIGQCDLNLYAPDTGGRNKLLVDDPLMYVLNTRPNPEMTAIGFREAMLFQAIPNGNAYAEIVTDAAGRVRELWPLPTDRVTPRRDPATWNLFYTYQTPVGETLQIPARKIFHLRGPGLYGLLGENVIARAAKSMGVAAAQERYTASFFGQGANPGGVLMYPKALGDDQFKRLKEDFAEKKKGPENAHKPLILENGMTWAAVGVEPAKSQLVEGRQFQVEEICFVPGTEIITPSGPRAIETLVEGDLVLTHRGRWRAIRHVMSREYDGQVVTAQAKGLLPVTSTRNHPFYAQPIKPSRSHALLPQGAPQWLRADELVAGARMGNGMRSRRAFHALLMPRLEGAACEAIDLLDWARPGAVTTSTEIRCSSNPRATSVTRRPPLDERLGWLCGLFIADGSSTDHQVVFYLGAHEPETTLMLRKLLRDVFGVGATTVRVGGVDRTVISNRVLAAFFSQFGCLAPEKRCSDWCMDAPAAFRTGIVDGLVAGDGGIYGRDTYLRTSSRDLAWQVRLLLWAAGRNSGLELQHGGTYSIEGRTGPARPMWTVRWRASPVRRGVMGLSREFASLPLDRAERSPYRGSVFNLEVEEDESYTTVGGVVHNCRWFGVPPHKVQHLLHATFSNIEHQSIEFVRDAINPWCMRIQQEADYKLLHQDRQRAPWKRTKFDTAPLLAGDAKSRADAYAIMRQNGIMTANEIRDREGMNHIGAEGDVLLVQSNLTTVEQLINPPPPPAPPAPPGADPTADPAAPVARAALTTIIAGALDRYSRALAHRETDWKRNGKRATALPPDDVRAAWRAQLLPRLLEDLEAAKPFAARGIGRELTPADLQRAADLVDAGDLPAAAAAKLLPETCPR